MGVVSLVHNWIISAGHNWHDFVAHSQMPFNSGNTGTKTIELLKCSAITALESFRLTWALEEKEDGGNMVYDIQQRINKTSAGSSYLVAFGLFLISSSLQACKNTLLGWPGVIPENPLLQSYETA